MESIVQRLEVLAQSVFDAIISENRKELECAVSAICYIQQHAKPNDMHISVYPVDEIVETLFQLKNLLTTPFSSRVTKKTPISKVEYSYDESMEETSFEQIFRRLISAENWHNATVKGVKYTCDFHTESLFCPPIMACISAIWHIIFLDPTSSLHERMIVAATALLHDIGKPAARTTGKLTMGTKNLNVTKFAAHGLIGGVMLQRSFSPLFGFSVDEWEVICRAVSVHMCGYHGTAT